MLEEENIQALKLQLLSLGFAETIERGLRNHICFGLDSFHLYYRMFREADCLNITVQVKRNERGHYTCLYYDASLRKPICIPVENINEVRVADLDRSMNEINWHITLSEVYSNESAGLNKVVAQEDRIESIIIELNKLAGTTEGAAIANRLKLKYWLDTPLEGLIPGAGNQKGPFEVSQRFFLFEDEEQITLEEAYRFLAHRWREKQLNAQRKEEQAGGPMEQAGKVHGKKSRALPSSGKLKDARN